MTLPPRLLSMLAVAALAAVSLCAAAPPVAAATGERVLHRTGTDDPSTVDPHKVAFPGEQVVVFDLFMGLTTPGMKGRPIAGCAESWTASADGRTWLFRLRPGLQWSDGHPLTAEDFAWSFRRALDPATAFPFASRLFPLKNARSVAAGKLPPSALGVSAPDPRTVKIELEGPTPYLLDVLATTGLPAPRHAIEKHGRAWIRPGNFVGNGPFVLERWLPNGYVRVRRNPRFWSASTVTLDAVQHYSVDNPVTMVRRFQSGGLDLVIVVPPERVDWARREFGPALRVGRGVSTEVLVFNTQRGPTADLRVRRALSMAMDREQIASRVVGFPGVEAYGYVPPGTLNYPGGGALPDFAGWPPARREAEARRLLAEAGYGPGRPLRMRLAFPNTELNRKVGVAIATMWRRVGVDTELAQKETKSVVSDVARGDFDAARFVWLSSYSDPNSFLERMLSSGSAVGVNASRYSNPAYDALLARAAAEVDIGRRAALLREAETLALADQPVAPIHYLVGRRLVSPRVSGFADNPRGLYPSWLMTVTPR
jgi:ABC-type oligopeptide transport system substrate-binding subunit